MHSGDVHCALSSRCRTGQDQRMNHHPLDRLPGAAPDARSGSLSPSQTLWMPQTPAANRLGRVARAVCTVVAFIVFSLLGG
jgi:hypothetical protein